MPEFSSSQRDRRHASHITPSHIVEYHSLPLAFNELMASVALCTTFAYDVTGHDLTVFWFIWQLNFAKKNAEISGWFSENRYCRVYGSMSVEITDSSNVHTEAALWLRATFCLFTYLNTSQAVRAEEGSKRE